jgi:hypothetical protein
MPPPSPPIGIWQIIKGGKRLRQRRIGISIEIVGVYAVLVEKAGHFRKKVGI